MKTISVEQKVLLEQLDRSVASAAALLGTADRASGEGEDSPHGTLAQLVFWHEQYVAIARSLALSLEPELLNGTFGELNARARQAHRTESLVLLASRYRDLQQQFRATLEAIQDWSQNFPIKANFTNATVEERVVEITAHIDRHVARFQRNS